MIFLSLALALCVGRDPFAMPYDGVQEQNFVLLGIAQSGDKRLALLRHNGKEDTVVCGDAIEEYVVTKIDAQSIELTTAEKVVQLSVA